MSLARRSRQLATGTLERSPALTSALVRLAARVARRRGADEVLLAEAMEIDRRPLERSLQIVLWASAITGTGPLPKHFNPGDHLNSTVARSAAADALRTRIAIDDDPRLQRDLIHVGDSDLSHIGDSVREHLTELVRRRAARPQRGSGLAPDRQLEIVEQLTCALDQVGVCPFLMSGTLLGFVREGSFLPHDYDIDLGLLPGVDMDLVSRTVRDLDTFDVSTKGERTVAVDRSGVVVDLFAHELREEQFWHSTLIHEWWNTPFELVAEDLDGVRVWVPSDRQRYLDENYGRWASSVPFYDISFDTPNRRYRHTAETLRFLHSRCVMALERGDRWLLENAARELRDEFGIDITAQLAPSRLIEQA